MAVIPTSLLALFLGFLQIKHSFCTYYLELNRDWNTICPESGCTAIDLKQKGKNSVSDHMDGMGPHPTVYCIVPVDPLTVPGLRHLWYRYHVTLAPASSKAVTMVMGNSTKTVRSLIEHTGGGGLFMPSNSKRVIGTRYGSCPYEVECVGVELLPDRVKNDKGRGHKFTLQFEKRLQPFFPIALVLGLFLFYISPLLTKNMSFYYSSGVLLGIVASVLILLYIFSRLVPKRNIFGLGLLLGGYSFTGFIMHWIYSQGLVFVQQNLFFFLCYIVISGMISFAILYRMGPAHERTMTLVKWSLQLVSLGLIFLSMQFLPFGVALVTGLLVWHNAPEWLKNILASIFFCVFFCLKSLRGNSGGMFRKRVKKRMLTEDEYEEQGRVETDEALERLRVYCRKNEKFWNNLPSMKGKTQIIEFIEGKDHIPEQQRHYHESEYQSESEVETDESDDSNEDGNNQTPQDYSYQSSGVPSPNPTPPAAPSYPIDIPLPPSPYQYLPHSYSPRKRQDNHFHTTYD